MKTKFKEGVKISMKKPEFFYIVYYHSYLFGEFISFVDGVFDSKEKAKEFIKSAYMNPVYDEDEDIWKLSGRDEFVHIVKLVKNG